MCPWAFRGGNTAFLSAYILCYYEATKPKGNNRLMKSTVLHSSKAEFKFQLCLPLGALANLLTFSVKVSSHTHQGNRKCLIQSLTHEDFPHNKVSVIISTMNVNKAGIRASKFQSACFFFHLLMYETSNHSGVSIAHMLFSFHFYSMSVALRSLTVSLLRKRWNKILDS